MDLLQCYKVDFAMVSETWLSNAKDPTLSLIESYGFTIFHSSQFGRGKGCAVIATNKNSSIFGNTVKHTYTTFEAVSLVLKDSNSTNMISLYRPPKFGSSFTTFLSEFHDFLSQLLLDGKYFILCGDFNVHWNISSESYTYRFQDLLDELGVLVTAPDCPTHKKGNTLDLILSDPSTFTQILLQSVNSSLNISDHYPVAFTVSLSVMPMIKPVSRTVHIRKCKDVNLESFKMDLDVTCQRSLDDQYIMNNFSTIVSQFSRNIKTCLDEHAPVKAITVKNKEEKPPWLDKDYEKERSKRRKLEKRYRQTLHINDWLSYQTQSLFCRSMIKSKKEQFFSTALAGMEGNQKSLFRFTSNIISSSKKRNTLPTNFNDDYEMANSFNNFFIKKIETIRESFPASSFVPETELESTPQHGSLFTFNPCTDEEIRNIIKKSGVIVSPEDILPGFLMDKSIDTLIPYLTKLVNLSLASGSFEGLKDAIVRPLLKTDSTDHNNLSNYRPVSNLTFLSKLVERVVLSRLQTHMDDIDKCKTQFGYKKFHSTETLLLKLVNDILIGLDSRSGVVLLLLDLSAAFDTVDHNKLINILATQLRIQGTALKWFKSYLCGRTQKVLIGEAFSEPLELSFGIPQGSVLGPVLFNIYVTSLADVFSEAGFQTMSYADDNSGYQAFSLSSAHNILNESVPELLSRLSVWMKKYFLKLNEGKTKIIVFGSRFFKLNLSVSINNVTVENGKVIKFVDNVKYLGAYLDENLSMKSHINKITSHCYFLLRNIKSIRSFLSQQQCELLVNATVTSRIDYTNALFFKLSNHNCLSKLTKLQNYASKVILQKGRRQGYPFNIRLDILHWLSIEKRVAFKVLLLVFKCIHKQAPVLLSDLLSINSTGRYSNSLNTRLFYPSTSFGQRAFVYYAPRLWNVLPDHIRRIEFLSTFKSDLKTYLFTNYDLLMQRFNRYRM